LLPAPFTAPPRPLSATQPIAAPTVPNPHDIAPDPFDAPPPALKAKHPSAIPMVELPQDVDPAAFDEAPNTLTATHPNPIAARALPQEESPAEFDATPMPLTAMQPTLRPSDALPHEASPPLFDASPIGATEMQVSVPLQPVPRASPVTLTEMLSPQASAATWTSTDDSHAAAGAALATSPRSSIETKVSAKYAVDFALALRFNVASVIAVEVRRRHCPETRRRSAIARAY
jgi:hypothetical protein